MRTIVHRDGTHSTQGPGHIDHQGRPVGLVHVEDGWGGGSGDEGPGRREDRGVELEQSIRVVVLQDGEVQLAKLAVDASSAGRGGADQAVAGRHRSEHDREELCQRGDAVLEGADDETGLPDPRGEHHLARVGHEVINGRRSPHGRDDCPGQGDCVVGTSLPCHNQGEVSRLRDVSGEGRRKPKYAIGTVALEFCVWGERKKKQI